MKQMLKIDYGKMVFIPGGIFSMGGNAWEWCADLYHYQSYLIDAKNEVCVKPVG
ncbi:MAG TPA: SUMF1/EgtB/PvdO family nonheme iron enzyme [Candidatus Marinimicrobia bacterium]|nr:SUMF1/EgtB/PvdO family nonheme iron enzyme [Candidatus Neomarinimicrobiota bacterium]